MNTEIKVNPVVGEESYDDILKKNGIEHSTERINACTEADAIIDGRYIMAKDGVMNPDAITRYEQRKKDAQKYLREKLGDEDYERYLQNNADYHSRQDENFYKIARTSIARGADLAIKNELESDSNTLIEEHSTGSAAQALETTVGQAQTGEHLENAVASGYSLADNLRHCYDTDDTLTDEQKRVKKQAVDLALVAQNTAYGELAQKQMSELDNKRVKYALTQVPNLDKAVRTAFMKQYAHTKKLTGNHDMAYAAGYQAARSFATRYFQERIARGQTAEVLAQLDFIEKQSEAYYKNSKLLVDKNGKPIPDNEGKPQFTGDGIVDPSQMLFCRHEDFAGFREAARSAIKRSMEIQNADRAARNAALKELDDRLARKANKLETEARQFFYSIIGTSQDPMTEASSFLQRVKLLEEEGYKDSGKLYKTILDSANDVYTLRKQAEERIEKQDVQQSLWDYEALWNRYSTNLADEVTLSFLTPNGIVQQDANVTGKTEAKSAAIIHGRAMIAKCKLTDDQRRNIEQQVKALEADKLRDDCEVLQKMARDVGFQLPQEQTASVFMYREQAYMDVDGKPSRQVGNDLLFNKDGLVLMSTDAKVKWVGADGSEFELGKNEAQHLFRKWFHIISQTTSDEKNNEVAYKRLMDAFKKDVTVVAKTSDVNDRLSKLVKQADLTERRFLGQGGFKSLSYLSRNYRTPQEHRQFIEMKKKAEQYRQFFNPTPDFNRPLEWDK